MNKRFAVFISGYGRGAIEIIKDYSFGLIKPELGLLLSDNPNSHALEVAKQNSIDIAVFNRKAYSNRDEYEIEIVKELKKNKIDYIFLAGWMNIVGNTLLSNFPDRIVNIHPSLLPSFKGLNAIDQALLYKVKITGVSTHFVDNSIDGGRIIKQSCVKIDDNDTFASLDNKIFKLGTILTIETINNEFI